MLTHGIDDFWFTFPLIMLAHWTLREREKEKERERKRERERESNSLIETCMTRKLFLWNFELRKSLNLDRSWLGRYLVWPFVS